MKTLKILAVFTFTLLLFSSVVSAQDSKAKGEKTAIFKGRIFRSDRNQPVEKVRIVLLDDKKSGDKDNSVETETDKDGKFLFENLKPGKYTISISAVFEKEEDVPCQLLMGKIDEPDSSLLVITKDGKKIEQIYIKNFSVKGGKEINKEYDLVCKSLFGK